MAEQIITKKCFKCKNTKPHTEFYKNRSRKDGLQEYCKSCRRIIQRKYRKTFKGKIARKHYRQTETGKTALLAAKKRFGTRYPNQIKAQRALNNAIQTGRLTRPDTLLCHYCPKPAQQYHHHKGYEPKHWLDVIPVCISCHNKCNKKIA